LYDRLKRGNEALFGWGCAAFQKNLCMHSFIQCHIFIRVLAADYRHVRAIPWPSGQWRARRRIDTGHGGRLHSRKRARGHVQPHCRGGENAGRGKGCRRRHRSDGGPPGGAVTPPRSAPTHGGRGDRRGARAGGRDRLPRDGAPLTAPLDGVRNRR